MAPEHEARGQRVRRDLGDGVDRISDMAAGATPLRCHAQPKQTSVRELGKNRRGCVGRGVEMKGAGVEPCTEIGR